ncbi:hypothetical protein KAW38_05145 [Candidatus Micrarchaeota archaeon]|nr:hypothetical protein [Candidatus Micrarchaeota archaeon]
MVESAEMKNKKGKKPWPSPKARFWESFRVPGRPKGITADIIKYIFRKRPKEERDKEIAEAKEKLKQFRPEVRGRFKELLDAARKEDAKDLVARMINGFDDSEQDFLEAMDYTEELVRAWGSDKLLWDLLDERAGKLKELGLTQKGEEMLEQIVHAAKMLDGDGTALLFIAENLSKKILEYKEEDEEKRLDSLQGTIDILGSWTW